MIKDTIELLEIDFSKYSKLAIDGVYLTGLDIELENHPLQVNIYGKKNGEIVMVTNFLKYNKVRITEIAEDFLSLREVKS